jgi:hypothetical protein
MCGRSGFGVLEKVLKSATEHKDSLYYRILTFLVCSAAVDEEKEDELKEGYDFTRTSHT